MNAECVVKFPNHTDDPGVGHPRPPGHRDWVSLAGDPAPAAPPAEPVNLADELRAMGLMQARGKTPARPCFLAWAGCSVPRRGKGDDI